MAWKQELFAGAYFLGFMLCALALLVWQRRLKGRRNPLPKETRLLRAPGETQFNLIRRFDEDMIVWVALAAGIPAGVSAGLLALSGMLPPIFRVGGFLLSALVFVFLFFLGVRWFAGKARERGDRYLGYFGERIVAEYLDPLKQQGWSVFHDVPCSSDGRKFNIDHVAVGPQGVFVIETKTRRKGGAQPGFDDYKVYFDGHDLAWPWGRDSHGLEQAEQNAIWMASTLRSELGRNIHVLPVLALPGWWVELRLVRDPRFCRVVNPKGLAKFLSAGSVDLDPQQIALIAAKFESLCRDVEY